MRGEKAECRNPNDETNLKDECSKRSAELVLRICFDIRHSDFDIPFALHSGSGRHAERACYYMKNGCVHREDMLRE
jgi:hypothetical protein